jgi:hypothetical protein
VCRGLFKVASKLVKASKECSGTVPNAWYFVANDFEQSAEIHKSIANIMLEEIAKPLKVCLVKLIPIRTWQMILSKNSFSCRKEFFSNRPEFESKWQKMFA